VHQGIESEKYVWFIKSKYIPIPIAYIPIIIYPELASTKGPVSLSPSRRAIFPSTPSNNNHNIKKTDAVTGSNCIQKYRDIMGIKIDRTDTCHAEK
jgi:hypothetical protein